MEKTPTKPDENCTEKGEVRPEKQLTPKDDTKGDAKTDSRPLKEVRVIECEFKTPEKNNKLNNSLESEGNENKTPEKLTPPKEGMKDQVKCNSTPLKEVKKIECEFKTPEKKNEPNQSVQSEGNENLTPEKPREGRKECATTNSTPLKEVKKTECEFKTPEKNSRQSFENKLNETPEKLTTNLDLKSCLEQSCDGDDGMISTTEQARLLIAASRTPSKSVNRTPVKQNTPSGKRSLESSPGTPGKHRRVELITLASPKAKRLKQI